MIGQLFTQRGNLLGSDWAGAVAPFTPLVRENVGNLLVSQCFVPGLHHRIAEFLAFHGDRTLQTLEDNHGRPSRSAGCKLRARQRRILTSHAQTVGLMTCLAIGRKNLLATVPRRKFCGLLCALRSTGFFRNARCATEGVKSVTAKVSGITAEIGAAKKYRQPVNCD